jgi:hypothetical protein
MAASLDMAAVIVEPKSLCHKLETISSLANVLPGYATGTELATKIRHDIANASGCKVLKRRAIHVRTVHDHVEVGLDSDDKLTAPNVVVATGVEPLAVSEVDWIATDVGDLPPLWHATPADLADAEIIVLGVDRPLGTLLRSLPDIDTRLIVVYHPEQHYKASEVSREPRVVLRPTWHASLEATIDGKFRLRTASTNGDRIDTATRAFANLGSRPVVPGGDLVTGSDGYCLPDRQHPRVLIAGDLRSARYQRIMTAFGTGAEAALTAYYQRAGVL